MAYSADKKPGELTALTSLATDDVFVVGDTSDASEVAKYITKANLITDLGTNYVADAINDGTTTVAPSQNAVFDALALKAPLASPTFTGTVTLPVGLTGVLRADTGVVSADTDVTDLVASASTTAAGKVELATDAETNTGTDTTRAITPSNLEAWTGSAQITTVGTLASPAMTTPNIGTPSAGTLTNCTGLPLSGVVDSTSEALGVGTLEVGHASDTTISRVSAGVIAVEGVNVLTTATGLPLTGGTMAGNITLAENASIALDPAGSADGKYSGITVAGTAGAALAFGDLCYLDPTDSRWELADANAVAAADGDARGILGICVLAAAGDASATTMLLHGIVRADTAFPALTIGAPVYVSETAGDIVVTQPTTTDVVIRIVGIAVTADEIFFNPDNTWTTHT